MNNKIVGKYECIKHGVLSENEYLEVEAGGQTYVFCVHCVSQYITNMVGVVKPIEVDNAKTKKVDDKKRDKVLNTTSEKSTRKTGPGKP